MIAEGKKLDELHWGERRTLVPARSVEFKERKISVSG